MKPKKLPSGSWTVQAQVNGVRKSFTAKTKSEALRKAQAFKDSYSEPLSCTLGELIDNYIESKKNVLSPSTVARYIQMKSLDFQRLMNVPALEITNERLQVEVNEMSKDHSSKSVRNAFGLISATLKLYGRPVNVTLPKNQSKEYFVPTIDQVCELVENASDNLKTAIMLAAFCGLRRGEIAALQSSDIEGNLIHVRKSLVYDTNRQIVSKSPKTYSSERVVIAPDFVIDHIKEKEDRVCPIALNSITRRFVELRDRLEIPCRFHDLRHFYASALHAVGIKDQYIMKFGGWKSDHVLKSVYRGTLDDFEAMSADISKTYFEESVNKTQMKKRKI